MKLFFLFTILLCSLSCSEAQNIFSSIIEYRDNLKIVAYSKAVYNNIYYGSNIGEISQKYDLKATPSDETFAIWNTIYSRLIYYNFESPWYNELYSKSMKLNGDWVKEFDEEQLRKSNDTIHELLKTNELLIETYTVGKNYTESCQNSYTHETLDIYTTWVRLASVLNDWIVRVYINGEEDNSREDVLLKIKNLKNKECKGVEYTILQYLSGLGFKRVSSVVNNIFEIQN